MGDSDSPVQELIQQLSQLSQVFMDAHPEGKPPKVTPPMLFNGSQDKLDDYLAQCKLYLALQAEEYPNNIHKILFILLYMKEGTTAPWATQRVNRLLNPLIPRPMLIEFVGELETMFANPNKEALARQKLSQVQPGNGSVDTVWA